MIFAKNFVTMNGHTSKLFKNIFYDVQTEDKVGINTAQYTHSKIAFLIQYMNLMDKKLVILLIPQLCFATKECKIDLSNNT